MIWITNNSAFCDPFARDIAVYYRCFTASSVYRTAALLQQRLRFFDHVIDREAEFFEQQLSRSR
ncbi:hypothetical protein G5645_10290, partial [Pectobacterium carotovorum]